MDKQPLLPIIGNKPILPKDEQDAIDWCERLSRKFNVKKSDYRPKQRGYYSANRR